MSETAFGVLIFISLWSNDGSDKHAQMCRSPEPPLLAYTKNGRN